MGPTPTCLPARVLILYAVCMSIQRPICRYCNINQGKHRGRNKAGIPKFASICNTCWRRRRLLLGPLESPHRKLTVEERRVRRMRVRKDYRKHVGDSCERCGFIALYPCQLDVDHIDDDRTNNDPSNLQTLCANCHRLVTYLRKYPHLGSFV